MRAASFAATVAILALAGCGGGATTTTQHHIRLTAFEQRGKGLFITTCGGCHTLADAGTGGSVGPAFDTPWQASDVREAIADGRGVMPAGLLSGTQAAEVAAYVAAASGR